MDNDIKQEKIMCQLMCRVKYERGTPFDRDFLPSDYSDFSEKSVMTRFFSKYCFWVSEKKNYPIIVKDESSSKMANSVVFVRDVKTGYDTYLISLAEKTSVEIGDHIIIGDGVMSSIVAVYDEEQIIVNDYIQKEKERLKEAYKDEIAQYTAAVYKGVAIGTITAPFEIAKDTVEDAVDTVKTSLKNAKNKIKDFFK